MHRIERDAERFRRIVRGKIRNNLRKYITHGELIGRRGKEVVSIPVPQIEIPHFAYRVRDVGGVGQGEGEEGTPIGVDEGEGRQRGAGSAPGEHILEVEVSIEELVQMLAEELELPNLQPRGSSGIVTQKARYKTIRKVGPESLRHFKRTFREALKRQMIAGTYNPDDPIVTPIREDRRYRSWEYIEEPESRAVIFYMMDVSGSMGSEQKEIVRIEAFWIDAWLQSQYKGLERRYIIHDASAREVNEETFYHTRESGGTKISSAYKLCAKLVDKDHDPNEWNIYAFHFSDGDNWEEDDEVAFETLEERLLPRLNLFCYGQVASHWGTGRFIYDIEEQFGDYENVVLSEIRSRDDIYDSIKAFLGKAL